MGRSLCCAAAVLLGMGSVLYAADQKETQPQRRPADLVYILIEMSDIDESCHGELQQIYDVLRRLDKNKDGHIDADELKAMRQQLFEQRADHVLQRLDTNHDGKISREEAKGQLKADFERLDTNRDGFIDRAELLRAIAERPVGNPRPSGSTPPATKTPKPPDR